MSELVRDPAIKLFGRTIPVNDARSTPEMEEETPGVDGDTGRDVLEDVGEKDSCKEAAEMKVHDPPHFSSEVSQGDMIMLNVSEHRLEDEQKVSNEDGKVVVDSRSEHVKTETDGCLQDKVLKKPDKILPCPRCNSMDTKFCYFNNYNVNQPRHFCKNCQRYWTAGGTMRNVPIGAGRRKNKHSASQYRHIAMESDALQSSRPESPDLTHHQTVPCSPSDSLRPLNTNGRLKFGAEGPLCESMASTLNIREQNKSCDISSEGCRESCEEPSCASSVAAPNGVENGYAENETNLGDISLQGYLNGVTPVPHFQCYSGTPWTFPWGTGYLRPDNDNPSLSPWIAPPAICPPTLPFPLMPAPFWGCLSGWPNGAWSVPWFGTNGTVSPSSSTSNSGCSGNASPTLGKHSRDSNLQGEEAMEKSLWVPKTLRIDDPEEAAKSSIWATLGIKPDDRGIFKPFQSKVESKNQTSEAEPLLLANPAAMSRSQSFQEST